MSQCERIVQYINQHGSITPIDAQNDLGCMRLASRITDLKQRGVSIISEWEEGKNRHGEKNSVQKIFYINRQKRSKRMNVRKYLAISIKHTEHQWKFGMPCVLWGYKQTKDDEKRCFADYTQYPNKAEVYSLQDWLDSGYSDSIIKMDEPAHMEIDLCKKWKEYDTVLIDKEEYIGYCKMCSLPLDRPTEEGGNQA